MSCIGTAGHVDHGKSTLVTALTGIDPDRLAEEKARGMTIDLGFAWLKLPSGREVSIVDVPGHESFIHNMLAGVGGIDAALLVVAADEGVMPQTDEHLAILDLLGVRSGVVALTKCDLVDAEWLDLVRDEVAERLKPTTLAGAPIVACSAVTREGLPELVSALDASLDATPGRRDLGRPRLPVDRVFSITGFGTVVTGTLLDGTLRLGQEVEILPRQLRARVRGLQEHKLAVEQIGPGNRVAVNLAGVAKRDVQRGDALAAPGYLRATTAMDVHIRVVRDAPRPIMHNADLSVYCGAAEVMARVALLDAETIEPGASGWAQLRLHGPLAVARGDRFIVRVPSPSFTIGGGTVIEPFARRHRRHDSAILSRLELLARADPEEVVLAALAGDEGARSAGTVLEKRRLGGYGGLDPLEAAGATGLPAAEVHAALEALLARRVAVQIGSVYLTSQHWERLRGDALWLLADYHQRYPLRAGMSREEWRSRLGLSPRLAAEVASALAADGDMTDAEAYRPGPSRPESATSTGTGSLIRLSQHAVRFAPAQQRAVDQLLERFRRDPLSPPTRAETEDIVGHEVTSALVEQGTLVKLNDAIVLERSAYDEAVTRVVGYLRQQPSLTVAEARDLLGTSRKYMLAIFEHLDEQQITRRRGDDRVLGAKAPPISASPGTSSKPSPSGS
jgi:selenocysteine-specific elongation factor